MRAFNEFGVELIYNFYAEGKFSGNWKKSQLADWYNHK